MQATEGDTMKAIQKLIKRVLERAANDDVINMAKEAQAEANNFEQFITDLLSDGGWPEGDINGGDFQDLCVKHGILVEYRPREPCREDCPCAELCSREEFGAGDVICYRRPVDA
jgi:hypothetical protein